MVSRCCFAEYGWEIYKVSKRTCWAIVLSIRSFVLPRSRCRRRRGLLHSRYTVARSFNAKFAYSYNEIVIAGVLFSATREFKNAIQSEHVRNTEKLSYYILLFFLIEKWQRHQTATNKKTLLFRFVVKISSNASSTTFDFKPRGCCQCIFFSSDPRSCYQHLPQT